MGAISLCQPVVNFPVDLGIRCDGTSCRGELVNCLQLIIANDDVRGVILFRGCGLVDDLCLLQLDLEPKELDCLCEAG